MNDQTSIRAIPRHCSRDDIDSMLSWLDDINDPQRDAVPNVQNTDWRTRAGVLAKMIRYLSERQLAEICVGVDKSSDQMLCRETAWCATESIPNVHKSADGVPYWCLPTEVWVLANGQAIKASLCVQADRGDAYAWRNDKHFGRFAYPLSIIFSTEAAAICARESRIRNAAARAVDHLGTIMAEKGGLEATPEVRDQLREAINT